MKTYTIKYSPDNGDNVYYVDIEADSLPKARIAAWKYINSIRGIDKDDISFNTFIRWLSWAA